MVTETRHSRHLREKGFITSVAGGKNKMFRLTRVGIAQANLLLLAGDDRPKFHRSESELNSMLPIKGKKVSRPKVLKLMLDWGKSEFDSSAEPAAYPPISIEQVMADPPYQS